MGTILHKSSLIFTLVQSFSVYSVHFFSKVCGSPYIVNQGWTKRLLVWPTDADWWQELVKSASGECNYDSDPSTEPVMANDDPEVEQENPRLWSFPEGHWTLLFFFNASDKRSWWRTSSKFFFSHVYVNRVTDAATVSLSSLHSCSKIWMGWGRWNKMKRAFLLFLPGFPRPDEFCSDVLG